MRTDGLQHVGGFAEQSRSAQWSETTGLREVSLATAAGFALYFVLF